MNTRELLEALEPLGSLNSINKLISLVRSCRNWEVRNRGSAFNSQQSRGSDHNHNHNRHKNNWHATNLLLVCFIFYSSFFDVWDFISGASWTTPIMWVLFVKVGSCDIIGFHQFSYRNKGNKVSQSIFYCSISESSTNIFSSLIPLSLRWW